MIPTERLRAAGINPLGHRRDGSPIWPIAGADRDLGDTLDELLAEMRQANAVLDRNEAHDRAKAGLQLAPDGQWRTPSKARAVMSGGNGNPVPAVIDGPVPDWLKASLGAGYQPGALLRGLLGAGGRDADAQAEGKALLDGMGLRWADTPEHSKATLGATGATGGYVLPNNLVDTVVKPRTAEAIWSRLIKVRKGVAVRGVDLPFRLGAPARMTFQDWGQTKENVSETYGSYTATMGTLARVMDIGKQYARFSAGAAEQDVMDELARAAVLGENYYVLAGAGTGSVGSGDPTVGIYTALAAASAFNGYTTNNGSPSSSTIAGSAAATLAAAFGAMAARSRYPTAVVTDAATYWTIVAQGSDTAGFWLSPASGGFTVDPMTGGLRYWGVPLLWDPNFNTNTGTTKRAIALDGDAFTLYRGMEFRIDSSEQAGNRWDQNLIGFRGEEEIGFRGDVGVNVGAAQLITALIP